MSSERIHSSVQRMNRREFVGLGLKTAAALPAASVIFAGCGSDEQRVESAAPAPSGSPAQTAPTPPPRAEAPPAAQPSPKPPRDAGSQLVTEVAAVASVVTALQYVNESTKPDQKCSNCQFYTATMGDRGKCQLFAEGLVKQTGWCTSWVAKLS